MKSRRQVVEYAGVKTRFHLTLFVSQTVYLLIRHCYKYLQLRRYEHMSGKVWALSDLHLPSVAAKTMDQYGDVWVNHTQQIADNVKSRCGPNDILLVPGDISWAKTFSDSKCDMEFISRLPCRVVMSQGNHDRWASNLQETLDGIPPNSVWAVGKCWRTGNIAIVSSRLWDVEGVFPWPGHMAARGNASSESSLLNRLRHSLALLPQDDGIVRILMVHFPPLAFDAAPGPFTELIESFNVDFCVYGHVHRQIERIPAVDAVVGRTRYILTSCDWLEMMPMEICSYTQDS